MTVKKASTYHAEIVTEFYQLMSEFFKNRTE